MAAMATEKTWATWGDRIGARIRALREARKLSLKALAEETGGRLSKQRIGNYEQGIRMPGPAEAVILGEVLGVPPARVLCLDEPSQPVGSSKRPTSGGGEPYDEWAKVHALLRPEERELVLALAKMRLRDRGVALEEPTLIERARVGAHAAETFNEEEESALQDEPQLRDLSAGKDVRQAPDVDGHREGPGRREEGGGASHRPKEQQGKKKAV